MTAWVCFLLAAGWLITAVRQLNLTRLRWLKRHDPFSLIPTWSFFTPYPGAFDCKLLYRDRYEDGGLSPWRDVGLGHAQTPWIALWNPQRRLRKAVRVTISDLILLAQAIGAQEIVSSAPYAAILSYIASMERPRAPRQTQFMVLLSYGFLSDREPKRLFVSRMHSL
jgi:hypothetical protein